MSEDSAGSGVSMSLSKGQSAENDVLLARLSELLDNEPPMDANGHPSLALHEQVGNDWAAWKRQVAAVRTLLAPRLIDAVLADYRTRVTPPEVGAP